MSERGKLEYAKSGAVAFVKDSAARGYAAGLIRFASEAEIRHPLSAGVESVLEKIQTLQIGTSTNLAAALSLAHKELLGVSRATNRAIVVITDGYPDDVQAAIDAATAARNDGITLIAIGTEDADETLLRQIATRSDLAIHTPVSQMVEVITASSVLLPRLNGPKP